MITAFCGFQLQSTFQPFIFFFLYTRHRFKVTPSVFVPMVQYSQQCLVGDCVWARRQQDPFCLQGWKFTLLIIRAPSAALVYIPASRAWWQWEREAVILLWRLEPWMCRRTSGSQCWRREGIQLAALWSPIPRSLIWPYFSSLLPLSCPLLLPLLQPPILTDWRKWTSANWPQWWGEHDSKTMAPLSTQLVVFHPAPLTLSPGLN